MSKLYTSLHYGDVHFPFQDEDALSLLYQITQAIKPDLIACHGDLLDCYGISSFNKSLTHRQTPADEIALAKSHLREMKRLAPKARCLLFEGNHEDRLGRTISSLATRPEALALLGLPSVSSALSWPSLLDLSTLGWEWHDKRYVLFDRMILKHGSKVSKWSAYTARSEWEKYAKSGISGHTHRRGVFEHRDHNGVHGWWEHGCLCNLDPDYVEDPDWQSGFLIVTWSEDRKSFGVEEIRIHDGSTIFRGKTYHAQERAVA